jgi:tRNA(Arg) A34 adenosine deaminase TadA
MQNLAAWTHKQLGTARQTPFASDVVDSKTGRRLVRRLNAVAAEHDPSSHAEVRALRAACKKLRQINLAGYTLYTTCEPCPMCMAMALWAGVDKVVFGATIDDASKHCAQIYVSAQELTALSDMVCEVVGPVARAECNKVFDDPRMQDAMKLWRKARKVRPSSK